MIGQPGVSSGPVGSLLCEMGPNVLPPGPTKTGDGGKFASGGSGHMFGKQSANQKTAGQTGKP